MNGEIIKESLQEWLCDNRHEVTQCIGIALHNHERTYAEWFKYVDDRSGPDELALYCLSRKHGVHTAVFNKSYVWTTLSEHIQRSDEEIMSLCGINLVFLDHTTYGIMKNIRAPNPRTDAIDKLPPTPAQNQKKQRGKTTCRDNSRGRHPRKRNEDKNNTTCRSKHMTLSESRHATFGITAPSTRSVRSSRQPIDYLTLNDGLDENTPISPKHRKRTHIDLAVDHQLHDKRQHSIKLYLRRVIPQQHYQPYHYCQLHHPILNVSNYQEYQTNKVSPTW